MAGYLDPKLSLSFALSCHGRWVSWQEHVPSKALLSHVWALYHVFVGILPTCCLVEALETNSRVQLMNLLNRPGSTRCNTCATHVQKTETKNKCTYSNNTSDICSPRNYQSEAGNTRHGLSSHQRLQASDPAEAQLAQGLPQ
jgi:hypothetical protein